MKMDYPAGDTGSLSTKVLMQLRQLILTKGRTHTHTHTFGKKKKVNKHETLLQRSSNR